MTHVLRLLRDDQASTAVEYAVMLALILMVIIGSIVSVGQGTGGLWGSSSSAMQAVGFGS
jgi:Flp pilus assembly pilin Flp